MYVATGERHKNHCRLIEAWVLLAKNHFYPSLLLTLCKKKYPELVKFIEKEAKLHSLKISIEPIKYEKIDNFYAKSRALIYPSLLESLGLPLLEAKAFDLPILASERDFVRDIVDPVATFDPNSAQSICSSVLRFEGIIEKKIELISVAKMLESLRFN